MAGDEVYVAEVAMTTSGNLNVSQRAEWTKPLTAHPDLR